MCLAGPLHQNFLPDSTSFSVWVVMAKRSSRKSNQPLQVVVVVASNQANDRLTRALNMVLEAAQCAGSHRKANEMEDERRIPTIPAVDDHGD